MPAGARLVGKDELFAHADILSVHLVLGKTSRGIVGAAELAQMKPSAWLVNTSRGPLVDEAALVAALTHKRIRGAALDVFATEPLPADHPLRALPNVVGTSHVGFVSRGHVPHLLRRYGKETSSLGSTNAPLSRLVFVARTNVAR